MAFKLPEYKPEPKRFDPHPVDAEAQDFAALIKLVGPIVLIGASLAFLLFLFV